MDQENTIKVTSDTVDGPVEHEINLDELPLERVFELVKLMPDLAGYYAHRLLKKDLEPILYSSDGNVVHHVKTDEVVSLFCIWDKSLAKVKAILSIFERNILMRVDHDWAILNRDHPVVEDFLYNPNFRAFQIDWGKEVVPAGDLDPDNEDEWEHQLVQLWDKDLEITFDLLPKYAFEIDPEEIKFLL
jgi:hypothetical protein